MKKSFLLITFVLISGFLFAQKKTTTSAFIAFDASTVIDNLPKAENKTAIAALDTKTGSVQIEAAVKNFAFANPRIQDHFNNTSWMNSNVFPKFTFKGKIDDLSKVNFNKDGIYSISVSGDLTLKDVARPITIPGTIVIKGEVFSASAEFSIKLADYNMTGGSFDSGKVSKEPKITVSAELK